MKCSDFGKSFIKLREALRLIPYRDTNGYMSAGWGHKILNDEGDIAWTKEIADAHFDADLLGFEVAVTEAIKKPMSQIQFDAFVSLAYNIGGHAFTTSSVARLFNEDKPLEAAEAFLLWNDHGHAIERRTEEAGIFKYGISTTTGATI